MEDEYPEVFPIFLTDDVKKEIYRLVDPNQYCVPKDAGSVIVQIEELFDRKLHVALHEKMRDMGYVIFPYAADNHYGRNYYDNCEYVDGWAYMQKFNDKNYAFRFTIHGETIIDVLVHGDTIVGKGNRHYRWFILEAIEKYNKGLIKTKEE